MVKAVKALNYTFIRWDYRVGRTVSVGLGGGASRNIWLVGVDNILVGFFWRHRELSKLLGIDFLQYCQLLAWMNYHNL